MIQYDSTTGFRAYACQDGRFNNAQILAAYTKRDKKALGNALAALNFRIDTLRKVVLEMSARADEQRYWLRCMTQNERRSRNPPKLSERQALVLLAFVITEHLP